MLQGKRIILGISGSIAAYKTPDLVRKLIKAGAEVKVVLTDAAASLVSPLALSTVSKHEVIQHVSGNDAWNNHVELGLWADLMLIAPCSANTLSKLAHGTCDNMLTAVYLSLRCPTIIAPAMDVDMWAHPAVQNNIKMIQGFDNMTIMPPAYGELASGLVGAGRMPEPEAIVEYVAASCSTKSNPNLSINSKYKKALLTAGPTFEQIDPVRFIGNHSTGKMGIALAETLSACGVDVTLVLGPTNLRPVDHSIKVIPVQSAQEMYDACVAAFPNVDVAIMTAAVADFRAKHKADHKIKKGGEEIYSIELVKNPDILATLGNQKQHQLVVGFALETDNELENAQIKLHKKNADFIVLNSLNDAGAGFGKDTNKVTIVSHHEAPFELPLGTKKEVAAAIVAHVLQ